MKKPDPALVRQYFDYTPETGELRWRIGSRRRKAGEIAGTPSRCEKNRVTVGFMGINIRAHIIIWAYQTGKWPDFQIDHINENPSDNRWVNLRQATKSENMRNITSIKSNTSGHKGVSWSKACQKWRASIKANGIQYHLGVFPDKNHAIDAYRKAAEQLHGFFAKHI